MEGKEVRVDVLVPGCLGSDSSCTTSVGYFLSYFISLGLSFVICKNGDKNSTYSTG